MNDKFLEYVQSLSPQDFREQILNKTFAGKVLENSKAKISLKSIGQFILR